jgi:septal ring-binding cell division protein DamX
MAEVSLISCVVLMAAALAWILMHRPAVLGETWPKLMPGSAAEQSAQSDASLPAGGAGSAVAAAPAASEAEAMASSPVLPAEADSAPTATGATRASASDSSAAAGDTLPLRAAARQGAASMQSQLAGASPRVPVADGLSPSDASGKPSSATPPATLDHLPNRAAGGGPAESLAGDGSRTAAMEVADGSRPADVVPPAARAVGSGGAQVELPGVQAEAARLPVGAAVGSLTAQRLAATREWLAGADDSHFSIQLLLTDFASRDNLESFLRERRDAGEVNNYYVFETRIRSNIWYGVLYMEYASFGAAKAALEELPEEFRFHQPFIRNVRDIATLG